MSCQKLQFNYELCPSYRRRLQSSREHQAFLPSWIRIQIRIVKSDPRHCFEDETQQWVPYSTVSIRESNNFLVNG
jgi:hypothetical protein